MAAGDADEVSADEVRARLAFRALWPSSPNAAAAARNGAADGENGSADAVKVGARVVATEDFMSDSGVEDKVQLKVGQRGVVKKINEAGHACIDFEDHQKLQWVSKRNHHKLSTGEEQAPPQASSLRQSILAELNEAFEGGHARRLSRFEKNVELLRQQVNGHAPHVPTQAPKKKASTKPLSEALVRVLRAPPPPKGFGPSGRQEKLADPPEKVEDVVAEATTLKLTLESLEKTTGSRYRQIDSLQQQLSKCQVMCEDVQRQAADANESARNLSANPSMLETAQSEALARRRARVEQLGNDLRKATEQAKRYQSLWQQQHRYLVQSERIAMIGGRSGLARHAAGDVVLVPEPPPLGDEQPEVWDVGTAVANPYTVDSWPFEPNVLARRTFNQETQLEPFREETEEDLEEEKRRFRRPFLPGLHLPAGRGDDEDEYDDDYGGPTGTSRSF